MKFSERWLRAYADPSMSSDALAHALTMAGLEVEERTPAAPPFTQVVVAKVLEVSKHPGADKLNVCSVDVGSGTPVYAAAQTRPQIPASTLKVLTAATAHAVSHHGHEDTPELREQLRGALKPE